MDGQFVNEHEIDMGMDVATMFSLLRDWVSRDEDRHPLDGLPVSSFDWEKIRSEEDSLTWFGHSNFLLSINGKKILIDPMFGDVASPVSFVGSTRFSDDLLHVIDELPPIDAVFITHDHYDHLDYPSIVELIDKVEHFFVPLGVDAHLLEWGVQSENITALNWWDEVEWDGLTIASVPAQHYSGRGLWDRNQTLWSGWVILGEQTRLFTSGDSSYGPHFGQIGEAYGPFDLTLIEGGQYDERWSYSHMFPEESVQAHIDVNGETMMLMHWGAFTLAYHGWSEPVERALLAAEEQDVHLIAPKIGETVDLEMLDVPISTWWDL
ncbi:outer membrane protein romA [Halalkalibacter hemicellulosilyticusJCM 9152]|uniref:Outer membrane protein romA n=1 Tax=Halalkalibacter hemicellulosilyticusJCM 9152 TaxID=1236971 RepID=W4QDA2_9BACI|nr:outer membrane protein romA [Halalkalibacter hemicellulosilyticusJCM 9152]